MEFRIETDSMGKVKVPANSMWGAQTQRAVENFKISGLRFQRELIRAMGIVKMSAAVANMKTGGLTDEHGNAIADAAQEIIRGELDDHVPVDIFQTGSGTSFNMNINEVIANRVNIRFGSVPGSKSPVHPNDHVNMGQSSNDVIPTAVHIALAEIVKRGLLKEMAELKDSFDKKALEFNGIVKLGRTHLQDATPVRLGQEFNGYSSMTAKNMVRIGHGLDGLMELALGGTAVGTGLNAHPEFPGLAIAEISRFTGLPFRETDEHFQAQSAMDAAVHMSAALKTFAVSLTKIANDIRWAGSGPFGGIGELILPEVQPGSSIMPGKINPVIPESVLQVCARVMGNDMTISLGGQSGNFQLNTMMPLIAYYGVESALILSNAVKMFRKKCVKGLKADTKRCEELLGKSLAMVTVIAPETGYDKAAEIAGEAYRTGKSVREVLLEMGILDPERIDELLDPMKMTGAD